MSMHGPMPRSAWVFPALAVLLFAAVTASGYGFTPSAAGLVFAAGLLVILFGTVFAAVHHAEVIAERIGEPYGTLLLTLAVTIIEVALIATIMLGDKAVPTLARDTVFAVVMIVCNGLVGICILFGGLRYREQDFQVSGANLYLSVLAVLATITLILPNYTLTTPGPFYSAAQLGFVSAVTIVLYGVFLYTQTIRHRDYFVREAAAATDAPSASRRPDADAKRRAVAALAIGGGAAGKEILAGGRRRRRHDRRAPGLRRHSGGAADPAAGKHRGGCGGAQATICRRASIWRWGRRSRPSG